MSFFIESVSEFVLSYLQSTIDINLQARTLIRSSVVRDCTSLTGIQLLLLLRN